MFAKLFAAAALSALTSAHATSWQVVATEQGKRIEIDRDSIVLTPTGEAMATGRIVLDKAIVDPRTSAAYRRIEVQSRFDCKERTAATLKRSYYKEDGELLRQEESRMPYDMPVRSGTPDDKLLREVCRPKTAGENPSARQTLDKVNEAASELRQLNETLIDKEAKKDAQRLSARATATLPGRSGAPSASRKTSSPPGSTAWSYAGAGAPANWARLKPEYALCAAGQRQSPIDVRNGIAVDLEPLRFAYPPVSFRVQNGAATVHLFTYGGSLSLLGKNYALTDIEFRRPAETTIAGKTHPMEAQLLHRAEDGQQVMVSVLLQEGKENPLIQMALNNLPLEKGAEILPPGQALDLERLLPEKRDYYTFMGSLTTPPCAENVLWVVLKQTQQVSATQLEIFHRLYAPNARPTQPSFGRLVKESR